MSTTHEFNPAYIYHRNAAQSIKLNRTTDDSSVLDTLSSYVTVIYDVGMYSSCIAPQRGG